MIELKNKKYVGSDSRVSLYDIFLPDSPKGIIVFAHGYKGFKDWGAWNLVANFFVENQFGFIKFNFSHNGGTETNAIDFPDLDAFGNNTYSKELFDLDKLITIADRICVEKALQIPIYVIGHSRGGGIVILHGEQDTRVSKIVSWAGVSDYEVRFPKDEELEDWKLTGVMYVENGRTKQSMPHYFGFYEDFIANKSALDIKASCERLSKPFLQIHGDMDLAVSISEGIRIARWTDTKIEIIKGAGHTFQTSHPWEQDKLPEDMLQVVNKTLNFFLAP